MTKPLTTLDHLAVTGLIAPERIAALTPVAARYAVSIPSALAALIDSSDPDDPIAKQFIPDESELRIAPEDLADPIGDAPHSPVPGIVHRYRDRVLLKIVSVCPVYCRFCFRREMVGPGKDNALSPEALDAALAYIDAHAEIGEVILTGGDPFVLSPRRVGGITQRLAAIPHLRKLRWHTRVPVAEPHRVTEEFAAALKADGTETVVALHANHPRELTAEARSACTRLLDAGILLLSQSVLLKSVNDDADTLEALLRAFLEIGIAPYYLHHPDLAPGTQRFRLDIEDGRALMRSLRSRLPDSAIPKYVLDLPGGYGKVPLESDDVKSLGDGKWRLRDATGRWHAYPPRKRSHS